MSWGGAAFDLSVPVLLSIRRVRPWAYIAVVGFHVATAALFPIGMFPWIMIASTIVFFDADELRRAGRFVRSLALGRARDRRALRTPDPLAGSPRAAPQPGDVGLAPRGLRTALVGFFAVQLLVPLRHLAYEGPVLWTEEGYRFSWRVMLVEKSGSVVYRVRDPASALSWEVYPAGLLTTQQEKQMAFQPDMILELAHHIRDEVEAETGVRPEVRADAFVSLNGRPSARLIDPDVDLARIAPGLAPKSWVLRPRERRGREVAAR